MKNKYTKEELEELIFGEKISYRELARINECSDTYIKKYAKSIGIKLPVRAEFSKEYLFINRRKRQSKNCIVCNNLMYKPKEQKFCSFECMGKARKLKTLEHYKKCIQENINIEKEGNISTYKEYILQEQNYKCIICNIDNTWNNLPIVFVLDHIDGNAANNLRENLRCVCPNCDSQLDTFKSRNKNSARKERYLKNYKN